MMQSKRGLFASFICLITIFSVVVPSFSAHTTTLDEFSEVRTFAGNGTPNLQDGNITDAQFNGPSSFVKLMDGRILIADTNNHVIRQIKNNEVTTMAGASSFIEEDTAFYGGFRDDESLKSQFYEPTGLAIAKDGAIFVADSANHAVRKINTDGRVVTIAGDGLFGLEDGDVKTARFNTPHDIAVDSVGNIYVADTLNHVIRKISKEGIVSTITKPSERIVEYTPGLPDFAGDFADGVIQNAMFNEPSALLIDQHDNLYVADRGNQRIRYIDFHKNLVSTVAGSGELLKNEYYVQGGDADGVATSAQFSSPEGLALVEDSTILIADRKNHTIRQLKNGIVTTVTGTAGEFGNKDGLLKSALFDEPVDMLVQEDGSLLILEAGNHQIRKLASYTTFYHSRSQKK